MQNDSATPHADLPALERSAFDHGARSGFNAWFFSAFERYLNHIARHHKQAAYAGIRPGSSVPALSAMSVRTSTRAAKAISARRMIAVRWLPGGPTSV